MSAIKRRVDRLEGKTGDETWVYATVSGDWSVERMNAEVTALALAAGKQPPFFFVFIKTGYGAGAPRKAKLL